MKMTKTTVCTNHAKTKCSRFRPNITPVPKERIICGTKLVNGDRSRLRHKDSW